jgi:ABC-type lipoprotein release transport system permease subunit
LLSWLVASRVASLDLNSPVTYLVVAVLQLAIALVAAAIPGRRAARASPLAALRVE